MSSKSGGGFGRDLEDEEHETVKNLLLLGSLNGEVKKIERFESELGCRVQWTSAAERVAAMTGA